MSLTICPPELTQDSAATPKNTDKQFDSMQFTPGKLADGQSVLLRPMGNFSTGSCAVYYAWACERELNGELKYAGTRYASEWPGDPAPDASRTTDWSQASRPRVDGTAVRAKKTLLWLVSNQETNRLEVAVISQQSLQQAITEILKETDDYTWTEDGIANFMLKITRKGTGINTEYSCLPKLSMPTEAEVAAFKAVAETAQMSCYLDQRHPLKPRPEFTSAAPSETEF